MLQMLNIFLVKDVLSALEIDSNTITFENFLSILKQVEKRMIENARDSSSSREQNLLDNIENIQIPNVLTSGSPVQPDSKVIDFLR